MGDIQKKVLGAIRERAEKGKLEYLENRSASNVGFVYLQSGFKTILSFSFNFQPDGFTLRAFSAGHKPVQACGFNPKGCSLSISSNVVDLDKKMPSVFDHIDKAAVAAVQEE